MGLLKQITRSRAAHEALGFVVARYLGLVRRTNRFVMEPADAYDLIGPDAGHRRHVARAAFHDPFRQAAAGPRGEPRVAFGDGELNAIALRHLGVRAIRGSGARGRSIAQEGRRDGAARHAARACRRRDGGA